MGKIGWGNRFQWSLDWKSQRNGRKNKTITKIKGTMKIAQRTDCTKNIVRDMQNYKGRMPEWKVKRRLEGLERKWYTWKANMKDQIDRIAKLEIN